MKIIIWFNWILNIWHIYSLALDMLFYVFITKLVSIYCYADFIYGLRHDNLVILQ